MQSVMNVNIWTVSKKEGDMTGADAEASARSIAGTARSMGIEVEG